MRHLDADSRYSYPDDRRGRLARRCQVRVRPLEERTLPSGTGTDVLASVAIPIALSAPTTGTLAAGGVVFYQINPTIDGDLEAQVDAMSGSMRLSLVNAQDQVLV